MTADAQIAIHIAIAALGGAAIGLERQWSGHATGPRARFGGIRTFTLLGGLAGIAGVCWAMQAPVVGAVLAAGAVALVAGAYWKLERHDIEATTEAAALVVIAAGVLAGAGKVVLSSGIIALTALILVASTLVGILPLWLAVVCHEGSTLLVIANGVRLLGIEHPEFDLR